MIRAVQKNWYGNILQYLFSWYNSSSKNRYFKEKKKCFKQVLNNNLCSCRYRIGGCPHENALLWKHTHIALFWPTVHTDPENTAPENALFWNQVSGWRNPKMQPSRFHVDGESAYFPKRWRHRPTLRPVASDLGTRGQRQRVSSLVTCWDTCVSWGLASSERVFSTTGDIITA